MLRRTELKRGSPMKRSGFGAKDIERKPAAPCRIDPSLWRQAYSLTPATSATIEKHDYVRSKKLREAYRLIPCQNCGAQDGTVCCAHANWAIFGKGGSVKASDDCAASLCFTCHSGLDQGAGLSREERKALWWAAHVKTLRLLSERGLWPEETPIPDTSINPWRLPE